MSPLASKLRTACALVAVACATLAFASDTPPAQPVASAKGTPAAKGQTPLRNTHWKLVALNGKPVRAIKDQREPHLILDARELRVSGSGGCNNVMGGFELDGDKLRFTQMASTMMMCPAGMDQERAFLQTLESVARYRIAGDALTLSDGKGKAVAKLRAVAQR